MRRLSCDKYPCHFPEQDCAFCFCPFYPCLEERTGGRAEAGDWCCERCNLIHLPEVAETVMDGLVQGRGLIEVWRRVERLL
jgi:Zn-finger protein